MNVIKSYKALLAFVSICFLSNAFASSLTDLEVLSLSGDRTQIVLTFDGIAPEPVGYSIEDPARISLDFAGVSSLIGKKYIQIGSGNTRNAAILDTGDRTRVVFSLTKLVSYATEVNGNVVSVFIGDDASSLVSKPGVAKKAQAVPAVQPALKAKINEVQNVDFRRTETGAGQVVVEFANSGANASVYEKGGDIYIQVDGFEVPADLRRRLDVVDFATAVHFINVYNEDNHAIIRLEVDGAYDYLAYQADNRMTVEVNQLTAAEEEERLKERFPYSGDKLSLVFQDIEVRDVLQIIANYVGINLVASDSINGTITLRLNNVPWDQALDLVLKTNGLDKRQNGNVLLVAPAAELAEQERLELEARKQTIQLAPLRTEYVQINYAKAEDIAKIISEKSGSSDTTTTTSEDGATTATSTGLSNGFLSPRGSVVVDTRTNTLIVTDVAINLNGIRRAIEVFDVPVRQLLIEARIVTARTSSSEQFGVTWQGAVEPAIGANLTTPSSFFVGLPPGASNNTFSIGLSDAGLSLIDLQIAALESQGDAEVVSQPKVITSDGQSASIFSGQSIGVSGPDGETVFVEAGLKLDVIPQLTPDDRVIMQLKINQDSISSSGAVGAVTLDVNNVTTQVLVDNGSTLVLGGVYRISKNTSTDKTPILGDLPLVGSLFRRTSEVEEKTELLIFITPKIIEEGIVAN
ncbi:type IV pilus secretin PilQ [Reinekea sp.]|uniref:type IV pilus secretin PilQ n=1 Tax=Reinekea sp. TaxID=1970455 RepID=UPI00398A0DB6